MSEQTKKETEWVMFGGSYREFDEAGLAAPGTLIVVDGDDYLIGDINTNRGVCDDCTEFSGDAVVEKYCIVWQRPKEVIQ
jgi:hypothetical protein